MFIDHDLINTGSNDKNNDKTKHSKNNKYTYTYFYDQTASISDNLFLPLTSSLT